MFVIRSIKYALLLHYICNINARSCLCLYCYDRRVFGNKYANILVNISQLIIVHRNFKHSSRASGHLKLIFCFLFKCGHLNADVHKPSAKGTFFERVKRYKGNGLNI